MKIPKLVRVHGFLGPEVPKKDIRIRTGLNAPLANCSPSYPHFEGLKTVSKISVKCHHLQRQETENLPPGRR